MSDFTAPHVDYAGISPVIALTAGICVVLIVGLFRTPRFFMPSLTLAAIATTAGLCIWQWGRDEDLVAGALRLDDLGLAAALIALLAGAVATILAIREPAAEDAGQGAFGGLILGSILGMVLISSSQNLVSFFVGLELLSIPLYVMCASAIRKEHSLESGLKYLVIGSVGSATLLYGFALLYGASGSMDFNQIAEALGPGGQSDDTLVLIGTAMVAVGLAFKLSLAPFHQWTPDVYQGAPTPVTAFMAVATKAAAFAVFIRFFDVALAPSSGDWDIALAVLAAISIVVGNVGAIAQTSLKRMLGYSGVAQAGYMLGGLVVASEEGVNALVFYLAVYTLMNLAAFAVIIARERETSDGDEIASVEGLAAERPLLAWPLTISMLGLAGLPATAGFIGKLYLIEALVSGDFTWLAVFIAVGTMISLVYYLRVVAAVWARPSQEPVEPAPAVPAIAGASPEADPIDPDAGTRAYLLAPALLAAAGVVVFGIIPEPLVRFAEHAGASIAPVL
jgi:NADH-quinone oxidoreductase subunit N